MGESNQNGCRGFTLIELAIVLVVIGLIIGGVLVGQDLIRAAAVRAQISQIEKYNAAVNTFRGKYGALPGDMNYNTANQFGFAVTDLAGGTRGANGCNGCGDGNGVIEGNVSGRSNPPFNLVQCAGEPAWFWSDLTNANGMNINLIEGSFGPTAMQTNLFTFIANSNAELLTRDVILAGAVPNLGNPCMPVAKIGGGNFVYVYSTNGYNYFGLTAYPSAGLTVAQAYAIDKKMDDGLPTTGTVQTNYLSLLAVSTSPSAPTGSYTNTTCSDATTLTYALTSSYTAPVCNLSFQLQ